MTTEKDGPAHSKIERFWNGRFGDDYTGRNAAVAEKRGRFWNELLGKIEVSRVLEVGCSLGGNLGCIADQIPPENVFGIDINVQALEELKKRHPGVNACWARAREIPFRDAFFDLTFTTGVLIHQTPEELPGVTDEIVRCSSRYVLCGEYYSDRPEEIAYRGNTGYLFKRDFGTFYAQRFHNLKLVEEGFVGPEDGFDEITWWLFEKRR